MIRTGVIEDDPQMVARITEALGSTDDIGVVAVASNFRDGSALIAAGGVDVLLCDIGLPDGSGIDLIRQASTLMPEIDIIVITIFGDTGKVLDAIKAGARLRLAEKGRKDTGEDVARAAAGHAGIAGGVAGLP